MLLLVSCLSVYEYEHPRQLVMRQSVNSSPAITLSIGRKMLAHVKTPGLWSGFKFPVPYFRDD